MLVLSQVDRLDDVLSAWRAIGIPGATIIESTGIYARERHRHIPARFFSRRAAGATPSAASSRSLPSSATSRSSSAA